MQNCNIKWLLDPGHGGLIDGKYQTPGKRSPVWLDGSQLFEGEFNRAIVARLVELMAAEGIPYNVIASEYTDVPLGERVRRANAYGSEGCAYLSIHANAGGGRGYEVYTSKGDTKSDRLADVFFAEFGKEFPDARLRSDMIDGDVDKEANFYVLKNTVMPAVLTESFFMDTESDCRILMSPGGRDKIALAHFNAIKLAGSI